MIFRAVSAFDDKTIRYACSTMRTCGTILENACVTLTTEIYRVKNRPAFQKCLIPSYPLWFYHAKFREILARKLISSFLLNREGIGIAWEAEDIQGCRIRSSDIAPPYPAVNILLTE